MFNDPLRPSQPKGEGRPGPRDDDADNCKSWVVTTDTNSKVTELSSVSAKIGSLAMMMMIIIMIMMIIIIIIMIMMITTIIMNIKSQVLVGCTIAKSPLMASWVGSHRDRVNLCVCVKICWRPNTGDSPLPRTRTWTWTTRATVGSTFDGVGVWPAG